MIDHITFGVTNFTRSVAFYTAAFAPLRVKQLFTVPTDQTDGVKVTGFGHAHPFLWLTEENPTTGTFHIALSAKTQKEVDAFYTAALNAGGKDNGAPGLRPHYHPYYYAAFVRDPDGHNIEVVCHSDGA